MPTNLGSAETILSTRAERSIHHTASTADIPFLSLRERTEVRASDNATISK
jgi:hypothetical protein